MKKLVFTLSLLIGIAANGLAYDFSAVCESGQTLYYTITSMLHHRVIVDMGEESSSINGDVILPMFVDYGGITYTVYGIGQWTFHGDTLLNSITLSDSINYIGDGAFQRCSHLREVRMGNNVRYIEDNAFSRCSQLESLELPDALYLIGSGAFRQTGLRSISVPSSVKEIWGSAFSNCGSLTEVNLPDTLRFGIPDNLFENCVNLQRIEMPSCFEAIGASAFENCSSLESIELSDMLVGIGPNAFFGCSGMTEIKLLLNDGARIQSSAFGNCSNLKRVVIDVPYSYSGVFLESNVFDGTDMESITIKSQKVPGITQNTFEGVSKTIPVIVPCGWASQYENAEYWSEFTNIEEDLLYSYTVVTEYDGMGTVQILHEPTSCEDGLLELLAVPQDGNRFINWYISDLGYFFHDNPLNIEPFIDGPIKAVFDGTGIDENNIAIDVYPNPTDGMICIDIEGLERIEVYTINGQFIKEFSSSEIDITELNAGTYLLKVFTPSRWVTKQIVKK